jgi:hypothetical protein
MAVLTTNFPTALDDTISLAAMNNRASTTLDGAHDNVETTIQVASTSGLASAGAVSIGDDIIYYSALNPATTIASGSNGVSLPTGTINVASTTNFRSAGKISVTTSGGAQTVTYTGKTGTTFTGCTGGTGSMSTGGAVSQTAVYGGSRNADSATAASHTDGEPVQQRIIRAHFTALRGAIIATETKIGSGASTPASGQFFKGTGTGTSGWSALTSGEVTTALGYTPPSGTGTGGTYTKWTGSGAVGNALLTESGSILALTGGFTITASTSSTRPLLLTAAASQSASLLETKDNAGLLELAVQSGSSARLTLLASAASLIHLMDQYGDNTTSPQVVMRKGLNTSASPSAVTADATIFRLAGRGYAASDFSGDVAGIDFKAAETFTGSAQGTYLVFYTTPTGTTSITEAMRLTGDKQLGINASPTATSPSNAQLLLQPKVAAYKGVVVRGATSQSGNAFEYQNSSTTALTYIDSTGSFYSAGTNPHTFDAGVSQFDSSSWASSFLRVGKNLNAAGTSTAGSANQNGLEVQLSITGATSSANGYEKTGILTRIRTLDPSDTQLRDAVGIDARGIIGAGNTVGRVWGVYGEATVESGADGLAYAGELFITNNATTDQSTVGTTTSKYGLHFVAAGSQHSTAAMWIHNSGATKWHRGLYADSTSLVDTFLELSGSLFSVTAAGALSAVSAAIGNPTSYTNTKLNVGGTTTLGAGDPAGIVLSPAITTSQDGRAIITSQCDVTPGAALGTLYGLLFIPTLRGTEGVTTKTLGNLAGVFARGDTNADYDAAITSVVNFWAAGTSHSGGGTITNLYGYYCDINSGIARVTNSYAFYAAGSASSFFNGGITLGTPLAIANGGTGQTSAIAAFNALSPLTTKGDLLVNDGTNDIRLAVTATNGQVIAADSAQTAGIKWTDPQAATAVRVPLGFAMATTSTATVFISNSSYAYYLGKATSAYTTCTVVTNVKTAVVTSITYAEVAIATGAFSHNGAATLTRRGFTDVSATYNSTGVKKTTITLSGVNIGDDLWVIFSSQATTPYQLEQITAVDRTASGIVQFKAATRPSTMSAATAFAVDSAVVPGYCSVAI